MLSISACSVDVTCPRSYSASSRRMGLEQTSNHYLFHKFDREYRAGAVRGRECVEASRHANTRKRKEQEEGKIDIDANTIVTHRVLYPQKDHYRTRCFQGPR